MDSDFNEYISFTKDSFEDPHIDRAESIRLKIGNSNVTQETGLNQDKADPGTSTTNTAVLPLPELRESSFPTNYTLPKFPQILSTNLLRNDE